MKEYIEREVALNSFEEIMNIACEQGDPRIGKAMRTGTCFGIAMCRNEVRHIPAADVVEVRHGRWDDSGRYKFPNGETAVCCTECGCALRKKEYENNNWFYCPVCGALMDKEE